MNMLKLRQLKKTFGMKTVVHPIDLDVAKGEFLAILGPSGCGKTTLLRMIAGLELPTSGLIELASRDKADQPPEILFQSQDQGKVVFIPPEERGMGMVFQSYAVWPHLTVEENVAYPLRIRKLQANVRMQKVRAALSMVHLEELAQRYPRQLSGGQQQRVALARGLVMEPPVLLLDEPLSNLDSRLRAEMRREIRELHRMLGITILYVTHDQREAFEMSTRILIMNEGRVAQVGTAEDIRSNPGDGFVSQFLSEN